MLSIGSGEFRFGAALLSILICGGCAPIVSQVADSADPDKNEVLYFLPKKDVRIDYTVELSGSQCISKLDIAASAAYPDVAFPFVAEFPTNLWGKNSSEITVTASGLLDTATGHSSSDVTEILTATAESIVGVSGGAFHASDTDKCAEISRSWLVDLPFPRGFEGGSVGDLSIEIDPRNSRQFIFSFPGAWAFRLSAPDLSALPSGASAPVGAHTGLFYRANLPYRVTFEPNSPLKSKVANRLLLIPNESPVMLARTPRSVFGDKKVIMDFDNGTLQKYDVELSGDVLEVVSLPLAIVEATSDAIGAAFDRDKDLATKEADALVKEAELEIARLRYEACMAAVASSDPEVIKAACGK